MRQRFQREGIISDEKWSADIHTADDGPTDAFGEIRFINNSDNVSKVQILLFQVISNNLDKTLNISLIVHKGQS